jgi:hypothetical protein
MARLPREKEPRKDLSKAISPQLKWKEKYLG